MNWKKTVKIKHLFNENEDYKSVQAVMNCVADILEKHAEFEELDFEDFRNIPDCNEWCTPIEAARKLLEEVYDIADAARVWIE